MSEIVNQLIAIDVITPHPRNYRNHPEMQLQQLQASHARFDQYRSVVLWKRPGGEYMTVAGHGIIEAMRERGVQAVRADVLDEATPQETIDAILVADNNIALFASDDEELLAQLLTEQQDAGYDLAALGSSDEQLRQMLEAIGDGYLGGEREEGDGGDDYEVNPDEIEVRCRRGEVWALGSHRLVCGDATNPHIVQTLMQGEKAVCCWTDPPYGVSYVGKTKDALTIENDGKFDLDSLLSRSFAVMDEVLEEGSPIYIAHPPGALSVTFGLRFLAQGWRLHQTLVWIKDSMVLGHSDYHYCHEPILFGYKSGNGRRGRGGVGWYGDNSQTSVFEVPRPKVSEEHPTMKPVALIEAMLSNSTLANGLVYDPFLGSGSTIIAGERLGRRVFGCEIDPRYATVILNRWEAETGQVATLLERAEEVAHA